MTDQEFLGLDEDNARAFLGTQSAATRDRLTLIYANAHNVNLALPRQGREPFRPEPGSFAAPSSTSSASMDVPAPTHSSTGGGTGAVAVGWLLMIAGLGLAVWGFAYDVGVDVPGVYGLSTERVANVDQIGIRHMIVSSGVGAFISGIVLIAAGLIVQAIHQSRR